MTQTKTLIHKDTQEFLMDVEKDLLLHVTLNLKKGKISKNQAQKIAQNFLALFPIYSQEDLIKKLRTLSFTCEEGLEVFLKYAQPFYEEKKEEALQAALKEIKTGNLERALAIVKEANYYG